jgi:hypothetical protein
MKKLLQIFCVLLISTYGFTQTVNPPAYADIDTNHRTYVNQIFGLLESNRVSTGLLVDYGFDFTDPKIYNGAVLVDSTLMEQGIYADLYKTLYTSRFNSTVSSMRHPTIHDSLCYIARQKEVITLSGLLYKYNAVDPNAQLNGKMQTVNGRLKDVYVSSVWQNPYQEFTTLAISPSIISYNLTYCKVVLPSNLWLTNMGSQVSTIQMDAGDGQGYRTVNMGTQISLNYTDTGWKHWIFKVTLTNSQQLYSHCKIFFNNSSNMAGSNGVAARGVIDRNRNIVATEAYNSVFGVAGIVLSYHSQTDQVLRRPLIVAEGFDPGHITKPEEPEGQNTFESFITSVRSSGSAALRNLISGNPGLNDPSEYDIVYVNWRNGTDYLQRNELVLEQVIRWVNASKQPLNGVRQPNVVLGSSMGGVIARMALGRMDRGGGLNGAGGFAAHETRLFVSLDAPHQGANVPLGYQAMTRHASKMYIKLGPVAVGLVEAVQFIRGSVSPLQAGFLADQPASKQLLTQRIDFFYGQSNGTNQQFLQELRTQWAYPNPTNNAANTRCIAISDGSECAIDQEFAAGSSLLYYYRSAKTRFLGDIALMAAGAGIGAVTGFIPVLPLIIPGSSKFELTLDIKSIANGGGNQVYYGNIKLTKKVLWLFPVSINIANKTYNAPGGLLPSDTYPGGFITVYLKGQPGSASQDLFFSYNNSFFIQRRFSFIPATSALDIGSGNTAITNTQYTARYIGASPPAAPYNTPFQNFTTAFNTSNSEWSFTDNTTRKTNNEPHEGLFLRTANWLADEMNGVNTALTNCSAFCTNGAITGNTNICNPQTLIAPFGNGVFYVWSVNNTSLVTLVPNGNTVLVTRNGSANGEAIVSVAISGACVNGNTVLTIPVKVGLPLSDIGVMYTKYPIFNQNIDFGINNSKTVYIQTGNVSVTASTYLAGTNLFDWIVPSNSGYGWSNFIKSGSNCSFTLAGSGAPTIPLQVTLTNTLSGCSSSNTKYVVFVASIPGGTMSNVVVSPNPANDNINVTITDSTVTRSLDAKVAKGLRPLPSKGKTIVSLFEFNSNMLVRQWTKNEVNSKLYNFSVADLRKGLYVLQVDRNNQTITTKIIIE